MTGPTPVTPVGLDPENLRQPDPQGTDEIPISGIPRTFKLEDALTVTCIVESEDDESSMGVDSEADEESDAPSQAEVQAARDLLDLEMAPPPLGFVVAITTTKVRRLHYVGNCGRRPGEHYRSFEAYGDSPPCRRLYDSRCRQCFPEGEVEPDSDSSDSAGSTTHSSE